ncbi:hypothetical protein [Streptomyces fuscichromogenes]|uniref:Uncharacterized protein n=1 Tax=Streptomyces fuscichromogenes TaxID=1324013 RepID=A0A917XJN0_9ACTN|nr:hypothetical protein [Streptomyces fuscichromogenes]GGN33319.1 hypothetical protein GCM10011578_073080 [Streptomyces fuscichromogenes]
MNPTDHLTAWDHAPTRAAWARHMAMNAVGLIGWPAGWVVLIGISTYTPNWFVWIFMPYFLYGFYRFFIQLTYFPAALGIRRVLRAYHWQIVDKVPSGLGRHPGARDDGIWFEFRNPSAPEEKIPLVFLKHHRSYWWLRRLDGPRTKPERRAQIEPLWFAGDPRFLGVVAAPGRGGQAPKRLHLLYQRPVFDSRCVREGWGTDLGAVECAGRAGARYLPEPSQPSAQG